MSKEIEDRKRKVVEELFALVLEMSAIASLAQDSGINPDDVVNLDEENKEKIETEFNYAVNVIEEVFTDSEEEAITTEFVRSHIEAQLKKLNELVSEHVSLSEHVLH